MKVLLLIGVVALIIGVGGCTMRLSVEKHAEANPVSTFIGEVVANEYSSNYLFWQRVQWLGWLVGGACLGVYAIAGDNEGKS